MFDENVNAMDGRHKIRPLIFLLNNMPEKIQPKTTLLCGTPLILNTDEFIRQSTLYNNFSIAFYFFLLVFDHIDYERTLA